MRDLTIGKESKVIFLFAIPMLLGNIFQQLYNVVDSIVVGNFIGKQALAAVGASFPVVFVLISLIIGISIGMTVVISQYYGAKDLNNVKRTIDTMFIFILVASLIITIAGLLSSKLVFHLLKLPQDVIPDALMYYDIFIGGIVMMFGFNGISAALRGLGMLKHLCIF